MTDNKKEIKYCINSEDLLISFNDLWSDFAKHNEAPQLEAGKIQGQSLWDHMHDLETRHIHGILLKRVREGIPILGVPFRCDAPHQRRYMKMSMTLTNEGLVEYCSTLIRVEPRQPIPLVHTAESAHTAEDEDNSLLRMCSWCNKVDIDKDTWVELEQAIDKLNLFEKPTMRKITHTICCACQKKLLED